MRWRTAGACLFILTVSCRSAREYREPASSLERAIYLTERDKGSQGHGLSQKEPSKEKETKVERVVSPYPVDWSSTVEIKILKDQILADVLPPDVSNRVTDLLELERKLEHTLRLITRFLEEQEATVAAYWRSEGFPEGSGERDAADDVFFDLRDISSTSEEKAIAALLDLAPSGAMRAEIEARGARFADLLPFLNEKLAAADAEYRDLVGTVAYKLRLEAILRSPGKEPHKIHLPGYDNVPEGDFQPRDRFGVRLSGTELDRFNELLRQREQLVKAGNRMLEGEASLQETFDALSDTVLAPIASYAAEVEALVSKLDAGQLGARIDDTANAFEALLRDLQQGVEISVREGAAELKRGVEGARAQFQVGAHRAGNLGALVASIQDLRGLIDGFDGAEDVARILAAANTIGARIELLVGDVDATVELIAGLAEDFETKIEALQGQALTSAEAKWVGSSAQIKLQELQALFEEAAEVLARGQDLLTAANFPPLPADIVVPEAIDVDVTEAADTRIALQNTPRLEGDRVSLRATLLEGDETQGEPYVVDLDVGRMGWYARMDPSVVLARAGASTGGADYRFSPVLSWLWSYGPRPDEDGALATFFRTTQFSIGPHAGFMSFDPDDELEIGLGLTIGLWNGILQGGVGSDLMIDDSDDRIYYFVGSSLIPLLQHFNQ